MTKTIIISGCLLASVCAFAQIEDGKQLFKDSTCLECHNVEDFKDKKLSKVKSFKSMKDKVLACQIENNAMWFDEDVHDVATYLNHEYYHFKTTNE
jgi:hypothetical protein